MNKKTIISYASGMNANIIVWICAEATEEHIQDINWLNEKTYDDTLFFLVEMDLWKIDDSRAAPRFNVVCKPNKWAKEMKKLLPPVGLTETNFRQHDFWAAFIAYLSKTGDTKRFKLANTDNLYKGWFDMGMRETGNAKVHIQCMVYFPQSAIQCNLWVGDKDIFRKLRDHKEELEDAGLPLEIDEDFLDNDSKHVINVPHQRWEAIDLTDSSTWEACFKWYVERAKKMLEVIPHYIQA
jgi:hypothetical protein